MSPAEQIRHVLHLNRDGGFNHDLPLVAVQVLEAALTALVETAQPVEKQWCAYEDGNQHTSWYPNGYGDRAGWEALARRNTAKYQVMTRDLYAAPQPVAVPDGWQLVPKEPTTPMISAYCEAHNKLGIEQFANARIAYPAMLADAPQPPVVDDGWRAMDSAPLDKTPVIVAVPTKDPDEYVVGEAYFDPENYEGGDWWWAGSGYGDYHGGPISEINHHAPECWRPLPPAPANGGDR